MTMVALRSLCCASCCSPLKALFHRLFLKSFSSLSKMSVANTTFTTTVNGYCRDYRMEVRKEYKRYRGYWCWCGLLTLPKTQHFGPIDKQGRSELEIFILHQKIPSNIQRILFRNGLVAIQLSHLLVFFCQLHIAATTMVSCC